MRIVSIIGARPQFIKAAPVCRALRAGNEEILVHSGQHFDHGMSQVFFDELGIPAPDYNLGVAGGGHGAMTGQMLALIEELLVDLAPDVVLVYGDTNTTLAGGLAAAKLHIPVAHVEAGLRSFNRTMPEEVNRVLTDHLSEWLFCPTDAAVANLAAEGITAGVHQVGDVMLDTAREFAERVDPAEVAAAFGVTPGAYYLATVHRAATADDPVALAGVTRTFASLDLPVLWPVHPRTRKALEAAGLAAEFADAPGLTLVEPVSYLQANGLLRGAAALLTDSGGMQKEAYFFGIPCVTLREETEWVETVEAGWNRLVGVDPKRIADAVTEVRTLTLPAERPAFYGQGHAAEQIARVLAAK
ncbi:MAG: non-hydrolyzing UDP-N-acetylglucosamine 2-epimerase [Anaerosomatales bacterium]